jgi:hypothetical protein
VIPDIAMEKSQVVWLVQLPSLVAIPVKLIIIYSNTDFDQ